MRTATATIVLALASLASAGLFPASGPVKMLDAKTWKKTMREERAAVVAFVAPWCGHCQRMAPELTQVARGLDPLVPVYAVDCDAEANKQLCAQQMIKGFPTVKMFPRGIKVPPQEFQMERTAQNLFMWVSRSIPAKIARPKRAWGISKWKFDNRDAPRAILLNKQQRVPLLWKVLANKYHDKIKFAVARDRKGLVSKSLGFDVGGSKESKVIVFQNGKLDSILYQGTMKYDPLVEFLNQLLKDELDVSAHAVGDKELAAQGEKEDKEAGDDDDEDEDEVDKKKKKTKSKAKEEL